MNVENMTNNRLWKENSQRLKNFICGKVNHEDHCHDILHDLFFKISEKEEKLTLVEQHTIWHRILKAAYQFLRLYFLAILDTQKQTPVARLRCAFSVECILSAKQRIYTCNGTILDGLAICIAFNLFAKILSQKK